MDYALNYLRKYISHFDSCWTLYTWKSLVCLFDYFHLNFNENSQKGKSVQSFERADEARTSWEKLYSSLWIQS